MDDDDGEDDDDNEDDDEDELLLLLLLVDDDDDNDELLLELELDELLELLDEELLTLLDELDDDDALLLELLDCSVTSTHKLMAYFSSQCCPTSFISAGVINPSCMISSATSMSNRALPLNAPARVKPSNPLLPGLPTNTSSPPFLYPSLKAPLTINVHICHPVANVPIVTDEPAYARTAVFKAYSAMLLVASLPSNTARRVSGSVRRLPTIMMVIGCVIAANDVCNQSLRN